MDLISRDEVINALRATLLPDTRIVSDQQCIEGAIKIIKSLPTRNEWIPISEKMPPFGYENPVWVTLKPRDDQEFLNDVFVTVCNFYPLGNGVIAVFEYNIQGTPVYDFEQVIAWMPYVGPEPYRGDYNE